MGDQLEVYNRLLQQIDHSADIGEVLRVLEQLNGLQESGELPVKDRFDLQAHAFRTLRELTAETPGNAEDIILERLLPECLVVDTDASFELYQHRECLADWLNQYPEPVRHALRGKILDLLLPYLRSSEPVAACWLVSQIGYRTGELIDALLDIIRQNDDKTGDTAIATLVSLGVLPSQRASVLQQLHKRVASRYNHSLVSALAELADPTSIDVISKYWLAANTYEAKSIDASLVLNILMKILDANSDDTMLQDETWGWLKDLAENKPDEFSHAFYLGQIAPRCNSVLVVPTMLEWLAEDTEESSDPAWRRYLIGLRLEECVRPRQLEGWNDDYNAAAFRLLRRDACQDTGHDLFAPTQEDMVKKKAWETILRAGYTDALDWFDEAVIPETGRFVQQRIIEWFALFRFKSLPEIIVDWITEEYDRESDGKDSRELMRRMAATRMARSSASREAFGVLLNFGLTSEGKAMMQSVYALAEVALYLIKTGETSIISELMEVVRYSGREHQRTAAAFALDQITQAFPSLLLRYTDQIIPALYEPGREPYEKGTLISALGHLEGWKVPDGLLQDMKEWARKPEKWMGDSSLDFLAHRGYLHNDHQLLSEVLGLEQTGKRWDLAPNTERSKWAAHIIGLLYHKYPDTFTPAVISLLRDLDALSVSHIYEQLRLAHGGPDHLPLPQAIKDVLIQRIHKRHSAVYGETEVFQLLGELAPAELAEEYWDKSWGSWLPDSRVALAVALGEAQVTSSLRNRVCSQLQSLAQDGQYKVRRAAFRSLARQSIDVLRRLCLSWSVASTVELRQRAAEACGWLAHMSAEDTETFEKLYQKLVTDEEKPVREAARGAWEERRQRLWTERYLSIIMSVEGRTNKEIMDAWRYGEALARIGDDSCIRALREHLAKDSHLPNLRYWIWQIMEKMQENWRKTAKEWPEPWFVWEGTIREGQGKVWSSDNKIIRVQYSIWSQPKVGPSVSLMTEWGGAIWPIPPLTWPEPDAVIELEDGQRGKVVFKEVHKGTAIFLGSGPYPE